MSTLYNKLVRDKIIDIIEAKGERATYHVANDAEYHDKLRAKLREEIEEFLSSENSEEIADVYEVIDAILVLKGWEKKEILKIQEEKRLKRGGFAKRFILEES